MNEQSVHKQIENQIKKKKRGAIIFPSDYARFGNAESAKKALFRLEKEGLLMRLAFGIYLYPKQSKLLGKLTPSIDEIAKAIAKRDKARIVPTGDYALNRLGLSTQVPLNAVFLTDGAARKIKVGKRVIVFKKTSPKNLSAIGILSGIVIQALKTIGKNHVSELEEKKILSILSNENKVSLVHDIDLAPEWIRKVMKKAIYDDDK